MTAPPETDQPAVELPQSGTGERAARRRRDHHRRTFSRVGFASAMVVLILAIPVLGTIGFRALRDTTAGRRIDAQNDPSKPRYEANVIPTSVMLLVETGTDGSLSGLTMLSLGPNDTGGSIIFIPISSVVPQADGTSGTLVSTFGSGDLTALEQSTANLLGLSFDEVVVMSAPQWQQFAAPVAPFTVDNPDRIVSVDAKGRQSTLFPSGDVPISADQVATYLQARNPTESDLAHLNRKQVLWSAWLAAIKASQKPDAVPGETSTGFGRYLLGLSKGTVDKSILPATAQTTSGAGETFTVDPTAVAALISRDVPLPTPANPGGRAQVRLLSGTGPINSPNAVAAKIVAAGGELTILGNADRFDYANTLIIYYDDQFAATANTLRDALGVGQVSKSPTPTDAEDVTIILGRDAAAIYGGAGG